MLNGERGSLGGFGARSEIVKAPFISPMVIPSANKANAGEFSRAVFRDFSAMLWWGKWESNLLNLVLVRLTQPHFVRSDVS